MAAETIHGPLGIVFTAFGHDWLEATMPVDQRTHQPAGLLHGGASVVLAESLGSMAAIYSVGGDVTKVVGVDINASHMKAVREGVVTGRVTPIKLGRRIQFWEIKIRDESEALVCICRLTAMVLEA